jgi:hypothetical protein
MMRAFQHNCFVSEKSVSWMTAVEWFFLFRRCRRLTNSSMEVLHNLWYEWRTSLVKNLTIFSAIGNLLSLTGKFVAIGPTLSPSHAFPNYSSWWTDAKFSLYCMSKLQINILESCSNGWWVKCKREDLLCKRSKLEPCHYCFLPICFTSQ